jgi:hypothetical protein
MLNDKLIQELKDYLNQNFTQIIMYQSSTRGDDSRNNPDMDLTNFIEKNRLPGFKELLFSFIDRTGLNETEIYKKAGIDRRHFSKIRSSNDYRIGKNTVIALGFALKLNQMEFESILTAAGYSLSSSSKFDLVIQFFLERKDYDLFSVNEALELMSLKPLCNVLE